MPVVFPIVVALAMVMASCASPPAPTPSPPAATPSPTPSPVATPSATASPNGSAGPAPTIARTIDPMVDAAQITPALNSLAFADSTTGWAAGSGAILRTTDGGRTWRTQLSGSGSLWSLSAVDRLHVWGLDFGGPTGLAPMADQVIRTTDGGSSWTISRVSGGFRQVAFSTDLTGWAVVGGISDTTTAPGRLEETTDGGLHWRASALTAGADSVCVAGPNVGWAASGSGVYRTVDGGRAWTRVAAGPNNAVNADWQAIVRCRGSAAWVLWTGGAAAGSEGYRVTRTLDGGAHWQTVLSQLGDALGSLPTIDAYAGSFAVVSSTSAVFLGWCPACGLGAGSSTRTSDGGRTFAHQPLGGLTGAVLSDITFPDAQHGWIAGSAGGGFLLATDDGGSSWHRAYPSASLRPALDIAFVSPTVGFGLGVMGDGRVVLRTEDGGTTWRSIGRLPADAVVPDREPVLSFVDAHHGWAAVVDGLLATSDGGLTWHDVPGAPPGGVAFADLLHGCAGWFGTASAATSDGGATWVPVTASRGLTACAAGLVDPAWTAAAQPFDPGNLIYLAAIVGPTYAWALGMLGTADQLVVATTDAGSTWTAYHWPVPPDGVGGFGPDGPVRLSFVGPTTGWLFTQFGHLFQTTDGGASWRELAGS